VKNVKKGAIFEQVLDIFFKKKDKIFSPSEFFTLNKRFLKQDKKKYVQVKR
jgi:hypothetical protein